MKIAIVAPSEYPIKIDSIKENGQIIYSLVKYLNEQDHEVTLFARSGSQVPCMLHTFNFDSIDWSNDVDTNFTFKKFIEAQHAYFEVFSLLKRMKIDVVHNFSENQVPVLSARFLKSSAFVTTLFTLPYATLQSAVKLSQISTNFYVANSYHTKSNWSPHTQIDEVIYTGIDLEKYTFSQAAEDSRAYWNGKIERESKLEEVLKICKQRIHPTNYIL